MLIRRAALALKVAAAALALAGVTGTLAASMPKEPAGRVTLACDGQQELAVAPNLDDYSRDAISDNIVIDFAAKTVEFRSRTLPLTRVGETDLGFEHQVELFSFDDPTFDTAVYGNVDRVTGRLSVSARGYFRRADGGLDDTLRVELSSTCKPAQRMF